jgi:ferredoxin
MAKATVDADNCVGCGACESTCAVSAISLEDGKAVVDQEACVECGACVSACPVSAISV